MRIEQAVWVKAHGLLPMLLTHSAECVQKCVLHQLGLEAAAAAAAAAAEAGVEAEARAQENLGVAA